MKSVINLDGTQFSLPQILKGTDKWPTTMSWDNKGVLRSVADFGTVFIGLENLQNQEQRQWLWSVAVGDGPVFVAPQNWGWSHVARALGFFKSGTEARRNGWDGDFQTGWNEKVGRVNKVRGSVVVFKIGKGGVP